MGDVPSGAGRGGRGRVGLLIVLFSAPEVAAAASPPLPCSPRPTGSVTQPPVLTVLPPLPSPLPTPSTSVTHIAQIVDHPNWNQYASVLLSIRRIVQQSSFFRGVCRGGGIGTCPSLGRRRCRFIPIGALFRSKAPSIHEGAYNQSSAIAPSLGCSSEGGIDP